MGTSELLSGASFLFNHQLSILNPQIGDEARQLQAVFLFVHLFLQLVIHQRNWNIEIANLEFRGIEGNVSTLLPGGRQL